MLGTSSAARALLSTSASASANTRRPPGPAIAPLSLDRPLHTQAKALRSKGLWEGVREKNVTIFRRRGEHGEQGSLAGTRCRRWARCAAGDALQLSVLHVFGGYVFTRAHKHGRNVLWKQDGHADARRCAGWDVCFKQGVPRTGAGRGAANGVGGALESSEQDREELQSSTAERASKVGSRPLNQVTSRKEQTENAAVAWLH